MTLDYHTSRAGDHRPEECADERDAGHDAGYHAGWGLCAGTAPHYTVTAYGSHAQKDANDPTFRACYWSRDDALADGDALTLPVVSVTECRCDRPKGIRCRTHGSGHRFDVGQDPANGRCACGIRQDDIYHKGTYLPLRPFAAVARIALL